MFLCAFLFHSSLRDFALFFSFYTRNKFLVYFRFSCSPLLFFPSAVSRFTCFMPFSLCYLSPLFLRFTPALNAVEGSLCYSVSPVPDSSSVVHCPSSFSLCASVPLILCYFVTLLLVLTFAVSQLIFPEIFFC